MALFAGGSVWGLAFFIASVIGPVLVLAPLALAISTRRRRRLTWPVAIPFIVTALCPLVVGAATVLSHGVAAQALGNAVALGYFPCILWTFAAVASTPSRRLHP
jgi:hypothetical protein